ncbi:MAG: SCO6745 family protein [Acidimicrobiales bacterium]
MAFEPGLARRTYKTVEPLHVLVYFSAGGPAIYGGAGLRSRSMQYFASRAAAMGPVSAEVVTATFFNFNPSLIAGAIPAAWEIAAPSKVLEARLRVVDDAMRQALGERVHAPEVIEAARLARRAAEAACERVEGRPLFAGHAGLEWPEPPHLQLWHAQTLLREFRGDGHVALLLSEGIDPVEALILHQATGEPGTEVLQVLRGWDDGDWSAGLRRAEAHGWMEPGATLRLSDAGRVLRQRVEDGTNRLAARAYEVLGESGCERLRQLARPLSRAVVDARMLAPPANWDGE